MLHTELEQGGETKDPHYCLLPRNAKSMPEASTASPSYLESMKGDEDTSWCHLCSLSSEGSWADHLDTWMPLSST